MLKITRPRFRPRFPSRSFAPGLLFGSGIQGVWYDPSDFSTMFQDVAGTTPVTAVGQSVALILDKSGNGNHASQSVLASRPLLNVDANGKYFLLFDGSNDSLLTNSVDFTATDKMTVWAGVRKLSDAAIGMLTELSVTSDTNNGAFYIVFPVSNTDRDLRFNVRGTASNQRDYGPYAAPTTRVLSASLTTNAATSALAISARIDGIAQTGSNTTSAASTGNFGNYPLYIGRRGNTSFPFNGNLYSLIVRGAQSSAAQISATDAWVNSKTGAY